VVRGGSWNNNQDNARAAYRNNNNPNNRNNNIGFRVCASHSSIPFQRRRQFANANLTALISGAVSRNAD